MTNNETNEEVARLTRTVVTEEGLFQGERKYRLRIQPCSLDIDLVVLSWIIMEKKRRDREGDGLGLTAHDEDIQGDAGADGGAGS